jgi:hypothetical protein
MWCACRRLRVFFFPLVRPRKIMREIRSRILALEWIQFVSPASFPLPPSLLFFILRLLLFILRLLLFILCLLLFILRLSVLGVWPGLLGALHRRRVHGGLQLPHDFSLQRSAAGRLLPAEVHHLHDRLRGLPCRHRSERERANNTRYCEYHCSNYLF